MNKKELTELDIRTKFITPAVKRPGWNSPAIRSRIEGSGPHESYT